MSTYLLSPLGISLQQLSSESNTPGELSWDWVRIYLVQAIKESSQRRVAKRIGIEGSTLSRWLNDGREPTGEAKERLWAWARDYSMASKSNTKPVQPVFGHDQAFGVRYAAEVMAETLHRLLREARAAEEFGDLHGLPKMYNVMLETHPHMISKPDLSGVGNQTHSEIANKKPPKPRPPKDPVKVQKAVARHDVERPPEAAPSAVVLPKRRSAGGK